MDWREAAEARIARAAAGGGEDEDARADEAGSHSPTRSSSISPLASAEHGPGPTMEEIERATCIFHFPFLRNEHSSPR